MSLFILSYKSELCQDQWTELEVAQLKLTGTLDCGKVSPKYYKRLQILFQSSGRGEGFLSVLPQTLVFVIHSLYSNIKHKSTSSVPLIKLSHYGLFYAAGGV